MITIGISTLIILLIILFCIINDTTFNFILKYIATPIKNWIYQPIKPSKFVSTQKFPKYNDSFDRNSEKLAEYHQNLVNDFYNKQNTTTVLNPIIHSGNNIVTGCYKLSTSGIPYTLLISGCKVNQK